MSAELLNDFAFLSELGADFLDQASPPLFEPALNITAVLENDVKKLDRTGGAKGSIYVRLIGPDEAGMVGYAEIPWYGGNSWRPR